MGGQQSRALPFEVGEKVEDFGSAYWKLYRGKGIEDGAPVSIFVYKRSSPEQALPPLVENCVRKLKTLRHPNVLRYIDSMEIEDSLYVVTEEVPRLLI